MLAVRFKEPEIKTRWCRDCRMDLFLSWKPVVIEERVVLCDICSDRCRIRRGTEAEIVRHRELRSKLIRLEQEFWDIDNEIDELRRQKQEIETEMKQVRKGLLGAT